MSATGRPSADRAELRFIADVLRLRQLDDPAADRTEMIAELERAAAGNAPPSDGPGFVGALLRSSAGPVAGGPVAALPADRVATILRRAAELDPDPATPTRTARGSDDPISDWYDELAHLIAGAGGVGDGVLHELQGLGFSLTPRALHDLLTTTPVCPDRELVRSVVTLLGGDWTGAGYDALHDAALDEQARLDGTLTRSAAPRTPSGIVNAEQLTNDALLAQVRPPVEMLPRTVHGRDAMVARLSALLDEPTAPTQVIIGKGGCGKSTVALAVAREGLARRHRVWWVAAGDPNQLTRGLLAIATELGAPLSELNALQSAPGRGLELLWKRLEGSPRRWLLIFDGADDPDVFRIAGAADPRRWFRRSAAGTVMVVSRVLAASVWGTDVALTQVDDLLAGPGARVILDRIDDDDLVKNQSDDGTNVTVAAQALSERLGGVALALRNVGDYLGSGFARENIPELVRSLDARRLADTHVRSADPRSRIATTWDLSLTALADKGMPEARTLLRALARFAPGKWVVPLEVIAPERLVAAGLPTDSDRPAERWLAALDGLCTVGLIDRKITAGHGVEGVSVHPLVAEVSLDTGGHSEAIELAAVNLLWQAVVDLDAGRPRNWPVLRRLEPHVYAVVEAIKTKNAQTEALRLADHTAHGLIRAGLFAVGEELIRHARALTPLGPEHPLMLATEDTLALALGLRGELVDAERRLRVLVSDRERICGPEDEATLRARDHHAWVLAEQGRLAEADLLLRDLLVVRERLFGADDVELLGIRHRIGWVTGVRGRPAEAETWFREILPLRREALGDDHMEVLSTRYRLAWAIGLQGRMAEAETLFVELAESIEQVLPPTSAPVVMVRARLGWVRTWLCRFADAERDYRQVLTTRERVLGSDHPRTLRARHDLAWTLMMAGQPREAEGRFRQVVAECDRNPGLGKDHPLSLDSRGLLAQLLIDRGLLSEADRRLRALVPHRRRVFGAEHPATLIARHLQAKLLLVRGQHRDAARHLEAVLDDQLRVLGATHRHVLATRTTVAKVRGRLGDLAGAQRELDEVCALYPALLDALHPEALAARQVLVWVLGEGDRLDEADRQCRALLADRTTVLGPEHPDTLDTRYRLAWLLGLAERGDAAGEIYREVIEAQERSLGSDHPHSLRSRHGLANELLRSGRIGEAERSLRSVLLDRTRTLGRRHPDTLSSRHYLAFARALGGALPEAEQSLRDLLLDQLRLLGAEHRDTLGTRERLAWVQARRGALHGAAEHWRLLALDRQRILGADHPDTLRALARLANPSHEVTRLW